MIIGTGVDVVNIDRFERLVQKNPRLLERLFVPAERGKSLRSLAARFAAKEAAAKALRAPVGLVWQHCWVDNDADGAPHLVATGTVAARAAELSINRWHLTLSHDDPIATAVVTAEHLTDAELLLVLRHDPAGRGLLTTSSHPER
ncbi:holo-ACP synthase [Rothia nasisuis]|uniref:holo-ACP synthase n=1 Tax=Rothia nasisuis TaxID=2109647 RepID=UPI001EFFB643|nr:holo-ACP synthase [Rothia nasisuis]